MHLKKTRKSKKEDTCTQISAKINAKRVSCWFVGAWMKTSLQSYILYEEQRANEPLGIRRPLLNIWNIYAALNFFYIFPLIFYARNEFCLPEQFSSLSWIPFENMWGFCGCGVVFLYAVYYRLKQDMWRRCSDLCSRLLKAVQVLCFHVLGMWMKSYGFGVTVKTLNPRIPLSRKCFRDFRLIKIISVEL